VIGRDRTLFVFHNKIEEQRITRAPNAALSVKGFIYGERGVWRPGDSLFLNFIMEDKQGSIPANHPVMFNLYNPQGQLYKRLFSNKSVDGFYSFKTATRMSAPTGNWNAEVKIGSIRFSKNIRIETIMPNRLKINLNIGDNKLITANAKTTADLHSNWLTGAPARNLAANITAALTSDYTDFEKFSDYNFNDNTINFEARNVTVFDGSLDESGDASFPVDFGEIASAPGFLRAAFVTKVFEPGGAFSIDRFSMTYSPFQNYVGIKLPEGERNSGIIYTGRDQYIDIATVDERGNKVSRSNLRFEMYKLECRWWWDSYSDEVAGYSYDEYHRPVYDQTFSSKNGTARVKVKV